MTNPATGISNVHIIAGLHIARCRTRSPQSTCSLYTEGQSQDQGGVDHFYRRPDEIITKYILTKYR